MITRQPAPGYGADSSVFSFHEGLDAYSDAPPWQLRPVRLAVEHGLANAYPQGRMPVYCDVCASIQDAGFHRPSDPAQIPNWREELACSGCGLISRVRFGIELLKSQGIGRDAALYLTEQTTPAYAGLSRRFPNLIGSEYLADYTPKALKRLQTYLRDLTGHADATLRHEDVTNLSLASSSLDGVLTMDVLEHVPDYRAALTEFHRILRPGGTLVITVPFAEATAHPLVRARIVDGRIEHLVEPEYHGDPVNDQGCLAFYTFGWDLLQDVLAAGFDRAELADGWCPARGYLGFVGAIVARKR